METQNETKEVSSPRQFYQTIAIGATALAAWLIYYYTRPIANVVNAIDNSNSNVPFAKQSIRSCEQIKEKVIDGDLFANLGFADDSVITGDAIYDENRTTFDCNKVTTKPVGLGNKDGTDLIGVLRKVQLLETRLRVEGNKRPSVLFLTINSAEPARGQKAFDPKVVKQLLQQITKNGYVVIIGSEIQLQNVLMKELADMPRVKLCAFDDAKECGIDWAFDNVRTYPWQ
jgi:hypothetical protein